jgi:mannosylglucosylglycerate synthase
VVSDLSCCCEVHTVPTCAIVSFRLGLTDGVSVVAASWAQILADLGFEVVTVAGDGPVDRLVAGLALDAQHAPEDSEAPVTEARVAAGLDAAVSDALADADLVVVENLTSIPLNLPAARAVGRACAGRPTLHHHHDPPWQRPEWAHVTELPLVGDDQWAHVVINDLTREQFAARGIAATRIYNGFATQPPAGQRAATRAALGVNDDDTLVVHPVRAIARKRVDRALALCAEVGATYWLLGDAEFGYGPDLEALLVHARCPVRRGLPAGATIDDAYAASDLVVFPSDWEGFGNPPVEAALRQLPAAIGPYPVGQELRALGFGWLDAEDPVAVAAALAHPDPGARERDRKLAIEWFGLERVAADLRHLLDRQGWLP